jgi:glycerol-3-phosphate dehydrogenase
MSKMKDGRMTRAEQLKNIQENPNFDVLVIGGGINGIGTFRDLAIQGLRVLLVEKGDFAEGASAASSHMLHGGIRYLENGEFRLVREALQERNRMLKNAPHYSKPLPTTIPIFSWTKGILNAPLKFLNLLDKPAERGAIVIKIGLTLYDWYVRDNRSMPKHEFRMKAASLGEFPKMNSEIVCTATYYDAWMPSPERICFDLIRDAEEGNKDAIALNYLRAVAGSGDTVTLKDELTGAEVQVKPKAVINAAGPWIDFVNKALGQESRFIGGTKGSHLILDNHQLHQACKGREIFFESSDGRIVLIFPFLNRVMVGTTDIRIDNPEDAVCTDEEIDYILEQIPKVFPTIDVNPSQVVYTFSGVRPLPASEAGRTGTISRDHSIRSSAIGEGGLDFPVHSLIGGKWTTWRAFSEESATQALQDLGKTRISSTKYMAIGGGKGFPTSQADREAWLQGLRTKTELPIEQLDILLERYGTYAERVAAFISESNDNPLKHVPNFTQREILFLAQSEKVQRLEDLLQRRSLIAMLGYAKKEAIEEIATIVGSAFGWNEAFRKDETERVMAYLERKHRQKF